MQALLVVDVQNEFSPGGLRPLPNYSSAIESIHRHVADARAKKHPIAWIQHHNKPHESRAFVPGTRGAELAEGLGPKGGFGPERLFQKDVFGAFSGTDLEQWLRSHSVTHVLATGFYAHACVSTTVREALMRGFEVEIDPLATGTCDMKSPTLGTVDAREMLRATLLQLAHLGATIIGDNTTESPQTVVHRTPLTRIAPEIFRKRLIIEGFFRGGMNEERIRAYFHGLTKTLGFRTYGDPTIHRTSGQGKEVNEGYDGFVPLIDSGIYIAAWVNPRFLSTILYTCGEFDADHAVAFVRDFFDLSDCEAAIF